MALLSIPQMGVSIRREPLSERVPLYNLTAIALHVSGLLLQGPQLCC